MRKIILLLLLQCSLAAVGQEKPKIFFSRKRTEEQEREICSFVLLSKTYPNLYDSVVSYDTFVIYSASIRFRPYRP